MSTAQSGTAPDTSRKPTFPSAPAQRRLSDFAFSGAQFPPSSAHHDSTHQDERNSIQLIENKQKCHPPLDTLNFAPRAAFRSPSSPRGSAPIPPCAAPAQVLPSPIRLRPASAKARRKF